jgi:hypothetical protein
MVALSWGRRVSCETVCADQRAPCWTFGCAALSRGRPDLPSPEPDGARVHVSLESIPSRVFTSRRPADPLGPAPTPTRFSAPSTASPGLAPCAAARPPSAAVPPSGFLNLSAVSWQARASRPCLMPQPPVGFSLQSLAPRRGRVRLSASPCSLAVLHRASIPRARTRPFHSGFHRRPRLTTRLPGSPPELGHRFHRACAYARIGFPGALTPSAHLGSDVPASAASKP